MSVFLTIQFLSRDVLRLIFSFLTKKQIFHLRLVSKDFAITAKDIIEDHRLQVSAEPYIIGGYTLPQIEFSRYHQTYHYRISDNSGVRRTELLKLTIVNKQIALLPHGMEFTTCLSCKRFTREIKYYGSGPQFLCGKCEFSPSGIDTIMDVQQKSTGRVKKVLIKLIESIAFIQCTTCTKWYPKDRYTPKCPSLRFDICSCCTIFYVKKSGDTLYVDFHKGFSTCKPCRTKDTTKKTS